MESIVLNQINQIVRHNSGYQLGYYSKMVPIIREMFFTTFQDFGLCQRLCQMLYIDGKPLMVKISNWDSILKNYDLDPSYLNFLVQQRSINLELKLDKPVTIEIEVRYDFGNQEYILVIGNN